MRNAYETGNRRLFLFITGQCPYSCDYCFMDYDGYRNHMTKDVFHAALSYAKYHQYPSVTLIGGEPLVHPNVLECIDAVNKMGFHCSISSAGIDNQDLLRDVWTRHLDDITISLDSADEAHNDRMRGIGAYRRAIHTIESALKAEINVRVTATVNNINKEDIPNLMSFLGNMGIFQLDIHLMSFNGKAKYRKDLEIIPQDWIYLREKLEDSRPSNLAIALPYLWVKRHSEVYAEYHSHCEMISRDRLSIMPNGDYFFCTLAIGEEMPYGNIMNDSNYNDSSVIFSTDGICRCERQIGTTIDENYKYICRFIKRKV